ncbi:MAG TPA: alpha/beta hydrolase [Ilumatobacteraceae bacterium]|nr:alpha/beta hydrolase [Ilumatobacteraceae bacterium]
MRGDEIRDVGKIAGAVLGGGVSLVEDLHRGIARRSYAASGPGAQPAGVVHDGVARVVYGTLATAARAAPRLAAAAAARMLPVVDAASLDSSTRGNAALAALNGLWGDRLAASGNALAVGMTVRHHHDDLPLTGEAVAAAFPHATGRLAVFVHGLCESDESWHPSEAKQRKAGALDFGARLASDAGCTPVYLRYNSGLHVSDNGAALAEILDDVVAAWPIPVDELVLLGHSMGGLVVRSACHQGAVRGASWVDLVHHVVCLGTPHLGAPLEKGTNVLSWVLGRLPETRGLAGVLNARSVGIKDLRFGSVVREDWHGVDLDEFLTGRANEVPFVANASYYFIGVTVTRDPRHPLGVLVGDLLVQYASASGKGRRREIPFDIDKGHHIGGLNHFDLLSHPDVYRQLARWLVDARS